MSDALTAIDDALDTGVADHEDPLTRELQELALALRTETPEPDPAFEERLGRRVAAGFPRAARSRPPLWRRVLQPAPAIALVIVICLPLALLWDGGGRSGTDEGGGGGAMVDGGADGGGMAAEGGARGEAAPALAGRDATRFAPGRSDRRIERSVALELETPVDDMAEIAERVTTVTNRHGGFVLSSSVSTGDDAGGDFELRIPSARLRPALRDLSALADVRSQSQSGRDVTREHVTAKDRLRAARAERRSLLRRLESAETDEEAEAIRIRLDLVAGEINGLRGQLRDLRLRTDYAAVTVALLAREGDEGGGTGAGSLDDAWRDAGTLLVGVVGVLVRVLAVALPLGLVALVGWLAGRTLRRRRRESVLA